MFLHIRERHVLTRECTAIVTALAEIILDGFSIVSSLNSCRSSSLIKKGKKKLRKVIFTSHFLIE